MHSDIVTLQFKNQTMVSSRTVASFLGKAQKHVTRDINDLESAMNNAGLELEFTNGFFFIDAQNDLGPNLDQIQKPRRGRPRLKEWVMNADGFFYLASKYNTKKALTWKSKVLHALKAGHYLATEKLPAMQAEIERLTATVDELQKHAPKQLAGSRRGQLPSPVIQHNLWDEPEIIAWEMKPKDELDELLLTIAQLRHCSTISEGLEQRKKDLTDKLVQEELNRRIEMNNITTRCFSLTASTKNKKKGK